ncbi:hypothetical protein [Granulosicoccus antarcticus]|nr:hypothetical protein [Granulosicoccus antarcticus]
MPIKLSLAAILVCTALSGCSDDNSDSGSTDPTDTTDVTDTTDATDTPDTTESVVSVDPSLFVDGALAEDITTEDCTLSNGTQTTCYRITIAGNPADGSAVGPYCPPTIDSTAEEGGTWIKDNEIYDVDGDFIVGLSTFFNDDSWKMYDDETRAVTVIDGAYGCEVAGDPENNTGTDNFCLECNLEFIDGGVERTMLIPVTPVFEGGADANFGNDNIGIALNGVLLGPPAPLELIVSSLTLGVFDDCGGHANPHEGYHYHASVPGANQIIGCFMGAKGYDDNGDEAGGGGGGPPQ